VAPSRKASIPVKSILDRRMSEVQASKEQRRKDFPLCFEMVQHLKTLFPQLKVIRMSENGKRWER
jgi:chromosome condensin MukBEF ATPase and DNA-binding subunit MukB